MTAGLRGESLIEAPPEAVRGPAEHDIALIDPANPIGKRSKNPPATTVLPNSIRPSDDWSAGSKKMAPKRHFEPQSLNAAIRSPTG